jgi:very-short-patch-repair endonuclease
MKCACCAGGAHGGLSGLRVILGGMRNAGLPGWCEVAASQSGVVSRGQAIVGGMSASLIDNWLATGRWRAVHLGVYAMFSGSLDRVAMLWAAVLRAGPGAALSYQTAAELLGLSDARSEVIHVTVPPGRHPGPISGVLVHRSARISAAVHPAALPPRTRIEETAIDLTQAAATIDAACDWLCRAVGRRLTTPPRLRAALDGRAKVRWRADLLLALADIGAGAHSLLERRYVRDVERPHGLPRARRQAPIRLRGASHYLDNYYPEASLAVELDGRAAHPPEQRRADMRRDNLHAAAGIMTLRYTWTDITERPCAVAQQVAEVMRMRGAVVTVRPCGPGCAARPLPRPQAS